MWESLYHCLVSCIYCNDVVSTQQTHTLWRPSQVKRKRRHFRFNYLHQLENSRFVNSLLYLIKNLRLEICWASSYVSTALWLFMIDFISTQPDKTAARSPRGMKFARRKLLGMSVARAALWTRCAEDRRLPSTAACRVTGGRIAATGGGTWRASPTAAFGGSSRQFAQQPDWPEVYGRNLLSSWS